MAPLAVILPRVTSLGAMGVFWAEPISDIVCPVIAMTVFYLTVWKKLEEMVEKKKAESARIDLEISARSAADASRK